MKTIILDNVSIPYRIIKKRNKNTYFYFKKDGYIQINLSKYQSEKSVLEYMINNSDKFTRKFKNITSKRQLKENEYQYLGKIYNIQQHDDTSIIIDETNKVCYSLTNDKENSLFKNFEKKNMLEILSSLYDKYKENKIVNIKGITLKTRYTKTRHGSCNTRKRNININLHLIKYGERYIEYVFLHEIAHLKHPNHSQAFYRTFEELCPMYKEIGNELKEITR